MATWNDPPAERTPRAQMDQRQAYGIFRSWGWSAIEAAWAAVHGPAPARPELQPDAEPVLEAEP
jgi:hypothetical protein